MFRSALDALDVLAKLKDRNVSLHVIDLGGDVTGNGISKLVFTILSYQRAYPRIGFAQARRVMEAMRSGICMNLFQASRQASRMSS